MIKGNVSISINDFLLMKKKIDEIDKIQDELKKEKEECKKLKSIIKSRMANVFSAVVDYYNPEPVYSKKLKMNSSNIQDSFDKEIIKDMKVSIEHRELDKSYYHANIICEY